MDSNLKAVVVHTSKGQVITFIFTGGIIALLTLKLDLKTHRTESTFFRMEDPMDSKQEQLDFIAHWFAAGYEGDDKIYEVIS